MTQTHEPQGEPISDRAEAKAALRESEERFRATFEQAAVGIAHISSEGRFLRINQAFCDLVGYTLDEMLARTFQEITHPWELRHCIRGEIPLFRAGFFVSDDPSSWPRRSHADHDRGPGRARTAGRSAGVMGRTFG